MNIKDADSDYRIENFQSKKDSNEIRTTWKNYGESTHFLIITCNAFEEITLEKIKELLNKNHISDAELLKNDNKSEGIKLYEDSDGPVYIYVVSLKKYNQNQQHGWVGNCKEIRAGKVIPVKVFIFAAVKTEDDELDVFKYEEGKDIFGILAADVNYWKTIKGFLNKYVILHINQIHGFKEGCIYYSMSGLGIKIPLTQNALNKKLYIKLPPKEEIHLFVEEEYKKYYKLNEQRENGNG